MLSPYRGITLISNDPKCIIKGVASLQNTIFTATDGTNQNALISGAAEMNHREGHVSKSPDKREHYILETQTFRDLLRSQVLGSTSVEVADITFAPGELHIRGGGDRRSCGEFGSGRTLTLLLGRGLLVGLRGWRSHN